jgi:hypothetical protein
MQTKCDSSDYKIVRKRKETAEAMCKGSRYSSDCEKPSQNTQKPTGVLR